MSFAEVPISLVEKACQDTIAYIEAKRDRLRAAHDAKPWWRKDEWDRLTISVVNGRQTSICEDLIDLCAVARAGGRDTIKVSAEDARCFVSSVTAEMLT